MGKRIWEHLKESFKPYFILNYLMQNYGGQQMPHIRNIEYHIQYELLNG